MTRISYIMAAHNAAPWIEAAISSALDQTGVEVEVVVVDDASTDDTAAVVENLASDARVRLLRRDKSGGPSAARNVALAEATGDWIGILDADDWITPERSAILIALAEREACDIAADNLLCFEDLDPGKTKPLLSAQEIAAVGRISVAAYLDRNHMTGGASNLGFLKPVFRRSRAARYDERLRIGEDFDFCLRAMIAGSDLVIDPRPMYGYRIRAGSLTRQLKPDDIAMMLAVHAEAFSRPLTKEESEADARFRQSMQDMMAYVTCRTHVRRRNWPAVTQSAMRPAFWRAALPVLRRAAWRGVSGLATR